MSPPFTTTADAGPGRRGLTGPEFDPYSRRVVSRRRKTLLFASGLFAAYYLVFMWEGIYTLTSVMAGGVMSVGLAAAAFLEGSERPLVRTITSVAVGALLAVGAVVSALYSHGTNCVGFDAMWAIPLIYGCFYQDRPAGLAVSWVLSLLGGAWLLHRDGHPGAEVRQWITLSGSAGVFSLLFFRLLGQEFGLLLDLHERATQRLAVAERLTAMGVLAAGVAHEVNNPLSFIRANVEFTAERLRTLRATLPPERTAELDEALADALVGCDRVANAVTSLRALSPQAAIPAAIDLNDLVGRLVRLSRAEIQKHGTLTFDPGPTIQVVAEEGRLTHVLLNLLTNASDAIAERTDGPRTIVVRTYQDAAGRGAVEVQDSGVGIDAPDMTRIFDPFFTTKTGGRGTGLGLALCARIVDDLHGEMEAESAPGVGSTFRVLLPQATTAA